MLVVYQRSPTNLRLTQRAGSEPLSQPGSNQLYISFASRSELKSEMLLTFTFSKL